MTAEEILLDNECEDVVIFKGMYDSALIGISTNNQAVYDYDLMVQWLIDNKYCDTYDNAVDFLEYNTACTVGKDERDPIIMNPLLRFGGEE